MAISKRLEDEVLGDVLDVILLMFCTVVVPYSRLCPARWKEASATIDANLGLNSYRQTGNQEQ
jgi:hypothetical protein